MAKERYLPYTFSFGESFICGQVKGQYLPYTFPSGSPLFMAKERYLPYTFSFGESFIYGQVKERYLLLFRGILHLWPGKGPLVFGPM